MKLSRLAPLLALAAGLLPGNATAERISARAIPDFRLGCSRYGHDHATVKNLGHFSVPGGSRIKLTATGGAPGAPDTAYGELHTPLKPGATWSSIARLPRDFASCEAMVDGARPL